MSLDLNTPTPIVIPTRKKRSGSVWLLLALLVATGGFWAWGFGGYQPARLWSSTPAPLTTVKVDEGDLELVVTENGTLESSNNATARCMVEALMGMVGGTQGTSGQGGRGGSRGGQSGQSGQSG